MTPLALNHTEGSIALAIAKYLECDKRLVIKNVKMEFLEADLVYVSKLGYAGEVEIKKSKTDIRAEFDGHSLSKVCKHNGNALGDRYVSYYSLAVPEGMEQLALSLMPDKYGLFTVGERVTLIRKPVRLPNAKPITYEQLMILSMYASRRFWQITEKGYSGRR